MKRGECLRYYQDTGYESINQALREKYTLAMDPYLHHCIKEIDGSMSYDHTGLTVYRGISHSPDLSKGWYHERAFSSTSTSIQVTEGFAKSHCCIFVMTIPSNVKAYQYRKDNFFKEDEVLLQRDLMYIVHEPHMEKGVKIYPCTIRPFYQISVEPTIRDELDMKSIDSMLKSSNMAMQGQRKKHRRTHANNKKQSRRYRQSRSMKNKRTSRSKQTKKSKTKSRTFHK